MPTTAPVTAEVNRIDVDLARPVGGRQFLLKQQIVRGFAPDEGLEGVERLVHLGLADLQLRAPQRDLIVVRGTCRERLDRLDVLRCLCRGRPRKLLVADVEQVGLLARRMVADNRGRARAVGVLEDEDDVAARGPVARQLRVDVLAAAEAVGKDEERPR